MRKRTYEDKMKLNMSFGEALERFAHTSPDEMHANIKRTKKKKPPGGKKRTSSGGSSQDENVLSLKVRRVRKRNTGR